MHPLGKVKLEWSSEFAYAIGLLVTDGCLYNDGRHINLTSSDLEQIENFMHCLDIKNKIGTKYNGAKTHRSFVVQFGDVDFYNFLFDIGLMPHKSKILKAIAIPDDYFFDFLRGHFDGDGTFYSYFDPRWRSSYLFYTTFISASKDHIDWLRGTIFNEVGILGHVTTAANNPVYQLKYAKVDSLKLLPQMYYNPEVVCLSRKREKINRALAVVNKNLTDLCAGGEMAYTLP